MKRPWQIWVLFLLCLAVVVPAMVWLTIKACQLDEAVAEARAREKSARQRAELEEDVSLALWRMDTWLAPLIAQEAARPHFVYRPFFLLPVEDGTAKGGTKAIAQQPSPLLMQPSEFVLLNFQVSPQNQVSSPQAPPLDLNPWALANGTTNANIDLSNTRVVQLEEQIDLKALWSQLPEQTLPWVALKGYAWDSNYNNTLINSPGQVPANVPPNDRGLSQIDTQLVQNAAIVQQQVAQPPPQQKIDQLPNQAGQQWQAQAQAAQPTNQRYLVSRDEQTQIMRGGNEYQRRNRAFQDITQQAFNQQRQGIPEMLTKTPVSEGVSRPLWLGPNLVLARRVSVGKQSYVQGAWLDWKKIQSALLGEIADLLPDARLEPVRGNGQMNPARMLAALPVRLVVPDTVEASFAWVPATGSSAAGLSPIRISLWIAWGCLIMGALAVAVLLRGVVSLSERRAAFVAAVTHELRTPLTTFRMYTEMLSEGMVGNEAKRQTYLKTLRAEAERLTHLVGNVLAYARLERGRPGGRREEVTVGDLADRVLTRLVDRATQAEMELAVQTDASIRDCRLSTDPAAVEQILFNLVDNACKYAAAAEDRRIHLEITPYRDRIRFTVRDHGPGISAKAARRLFIPFSKSVHDAARTAPGVGLGLALSRRLACELGGQLDSRTGNGDGAAFVLTLPAATSRPSAGE